MIKRFTSQHIIRAAKLELDVFKTSGHIYDTENWNVENFSRSMPSKFDLSFVYEKDIDIIGFTVGYRYQHNWAHISRVAVSPMHQRKGIARSLLERQLHEMTLLEIERATLDVISINVGAIKFYSALGFRQLSGKELESFVIDRGRTSGEYLGVNPLRMVFEFTFNV